MAIDTNAALVHDRDMINPTMNQKRNPELFAQATTKGHELGLYVATMGWVKADLTIARAATGFVNRLPLNNIPLEKELHDAFIAAAIKAAESQNPENAEVR